MFEGEKHPSTFWSRAAPACSSRPQSKTLNTPGGGTFKGAKRSSHLLSKILPLAAAQLATITPGSATSYLPHLALHLFSLLDQRNLTVFSMPQLAARSDRFQSKALNTLGGGTCKGAKHLSLQYRMLPRTQLSETLPLIDCLNSLSLAQSTVTDTFLSGVGLYCPLLSHLNNSYCTQLSDFGLHCFPEEERELAACVSACPRLALLHLATQPDLEDSLLALLDLEELVELKVSDESDQCCLVRLKLLICDL